LYLRTFVHAYRENKEGNFSLPAFVHNQEAEVSHQNGGATHPLCIILTYAFDDL
jgi:hypothetical protein